MIIPYKLNEVFLSFERLIWIKYFLVISTIEMLIVCRHMLIVNVIIYCLMPLMDRFYRGQYSLVMYVSFRWFGLLNL